MSESTTNRPAPQRPAGTLLNLILILLTPMFLGAAGGDLTFARLAAAETLAAYRAETHADFITIGKIIAFGLATLDTLGLSMADDLSIAKILRLRSSANASDRAEHRNRLLLDRAQPESSASQPLSRPAIDETAPSFADARQLTPDTLANFPSSAPTTIPTAGNEQYNHATWAARAAAIAAETAACLPTLSLMERQSPAVQIEALSGAATSFPAGEIPPRPKPGNLAADIHGA